MATPPRFPWEHHGETLTVETPEQTRVEYRIASFGTRIVAALLDYLLVYAILAFLILIGLLTLVSTDDLGGSAGLPYQVALFYLLGWLVQMFYFVWFELRWEGQTPGKRRFGIRTVLVTGRGTAAGPVLVRNLARLVDNTVVLWIVPALVPGRRRLGDLLAGTAVIDEGRPDRGRAPRGVPAITGRTRADLGERRFYFSAATAAKLHRDDLDLLEFLDTRLRRAPRLRRPALLREVAERYTSRLGLDADRDRVLEDPLRFLQELALLLGERFGERPW